MKREHLLLLAAGFVLGAVVCYIVMKQQAVPVSPAPVAGASAPAGAGEPAPAFDPDQHNSMIAGFIAKAKSDPQDVQSKIMLGNIYYDKGDFREALPWYEEALKLQPANTDVIVDLGVCYREMGDFEKALSYFDQALKVDPVKKQALFNRVVVYAADLKQKDKAEAALKEFEKAFPGDPAAARFRENLAQLP